MINLAKHPHVVNTIKIIATDIGIDEGMLTSILEKFSLALLANTENQIDPALYFIMSSIYAVNSSDEAVEALATISLKRQSDLLISCANQGMDMSQIELLAVPKPSSTEEAWATAALVSEHLVKVANNS